MKILSWNVNGIRSVLTKGFDGFLKKFKPDILCLQETKPPNRDFRLEVNGQYQQFWSAGKKPGYAGTGIFSKITSRNVSYGMGIAKHDQEGRIITLELDEFFLVNVYVPNSKRGLERLPYRAQEWDVDFLGFLKKLEKSKPVVFCGDMNVAHQKIDLSNPKGNERNHGFTKEERAGFDRMIRSGFIDTFREFHKDGGYYTWWSQFNNCRKRNIGWRIDYFCISKSLRPCLKESFILKDILGSDHCPIGIVLH